MKNYVLTFVVLISFLSTAQQDTIHIHYFPNGKVSTFTYIVDQREGKALAYNLAGEIIYEKGVRRIYGSSGVNFTHHPNGMVHKANYSSHPDGGIQWYRTYTEFNDKGELIKEVEDNYEGPGRPSPHILRMNPNETLPKQQPAPTIKEKEPNPKKETVTCATIHQNLVEVVNHTNFKIEVTFIYQNKDTVMVLNQGEKASGPTFISAEVSRPVKENITFRFSPTKRRKNVIEIIKTNQLEQYKTKHVIHLLESSTKR